MSFVGAPFSYRRSSHEDLPSRLLLMGAPTGTNESCCRPPREFLMGAITRLLHMETPSELLLKLFEGSKWELLWSS